MLWAYPAPVHALEISEVTVDFPLAEALELGSDAAADASGGQPGTEAVSQRSSWEEDWFAYRQNVLRGNLSEARKSLDRVVTYRLRIGVPNLYLPSAALLSEASEARKQGQQEDALELIDYAQRLAPDDPTPHFQRARSIWSQNKLRALSAIDAALEGIGYFFKDFRSYFPWALGIAAWLLMSVAAASVATILLFALKVLPRLAHDLSHLLRIPQLVWFLVLPVILLLALLAGMPLVPWLMLLALLMITHVRPEERVTVGVALLLLTSIPLLIQVFSLSNTYYSSASVRSLYEAERGGEGTREIGPLDALRVANPGDQRILGALALVLKRSGQIREGEALLQKAREVAPDSPEIINNLANILLANGRIEQAIGQYRLALQYRDDARIHYNLSQALRDNLQLEEGEQEFVIAQRMDQQLTASLSARQVEVDAAVGQRVTVDMLTRPVFFLRAALRTTEEGKRWREALWAGIVPKVSFRASWFFFPLVSDLFFAGWALEGRVSTARTCRKCNRLHCPRCSKSTGDALCAQCRQVFLVRSGVDPANRVRKMMQIMRFQKNRSYLSRLGTVLFPGMGHVFLGAGWQSLMYILVTMLFWTKWLLWYGLYRNPTMLEIQAGTTPRVLLGVLMILYYIIALRGVVVRLEER